MDPIFTRDDKPEKGGSLTPEKEPPRRSTAPEAGALSDEARGLRATVLDALKSAEDPETLREKLSELGPMVLAMQAEIALRGSEVALEDIVSGKLQARSRATTVGIAVDKMAQAGPLLAKLSPTTFIIENHVPFPWDPTQADMSGFSVKFGDGNGGSTDQVGVPERSESGSTP